MNPYKEVVEELERKPEIYYGRKTVILSEYYWTLKGFEYWLKEIYGDVPEYLPGFQKYVTDRLLGDLPIEKEWALIFKLFSFSQDNSYKVFKEYKEEFLVQCAANNEDTLYEAWSSNEKNKKDIFLDYAVLYDRFRKNPDKYFGVKSYERMNDFLFGCGLCHMLYIAEQPLYPITEKSNEIIQSKIKNDIPYFREFMFSYYNLSGLMDFSWSYILEYICDFSDEKTFDTFFMLYDLYREKYQIE